MKNSRKMHIEKNYLADRIKEMCEIIRSTYEDGYARCFERVIGSYNAQWCC